MVGLLQEQLNADPWKIFVCCIFCNMTSRKTAEPYFWKVLDHYPTPKDLSEAKTLAGTQAFDVFVQEWNFVNYY